MPGQNERDAVGIGSKTVGGPGRQGSEGGFWRRPGLARMRRRGRRFGWLRGFGTSWFTGWQCSECDDELCMLKSGVKFLEKELKAARQRIGELESARDDGTEIADRQGSDNA